jgi:hypothetical protein
MTDRNYNLGSNSTYTDFFSGVSKKKLFSFGYGRFGQQDTFYNFQGGIDDVRIYNRPLSASEVKELYNLAFLPTTSNTVIENDKINLRQNYPNPFSSETVISWHSSESGETKIELLDLMGRKVNTLVDKYNDAGDHEFIFYPQNLSSGIYYYQLFIDKHRLSRKMVLKK